jgi:hypothetical protein
MIFAIGWAQASTDRLNEQNATLRRTCENDATHVQIDAGRKHADVADNSSLAGTKASEDCFSVFAGGRPIHILRGDIRLHEPLCNMLRVTAVDAEAECRSPLAALDPGVDDVAGHDGAVHRIGEFPFVEISSDGLHPGEVGLARREGFEVREKTIADQIGCGRCSDQVVVMSAETAGPRRRREADESARWMMWVTLSLSAHRALVRIEIELAHHGGNDNGKLPVTFDDFVQYGVRRHSIGSSLDELETLGFIKITQHGKMAKGAEYRRPNLFLLATRPELEGVGPERCRCRRFQTLEEAERALELVRARRQNLKAASAQTAPKPSAETAPKAKSASAETAPLALAETAPLSISRVGTPSQRRNLATRHHPEATRPADTAVAAPAFGLIDSSFRIGDRRIERRRPVAPALNLTAAQLAQQLAATHPSNADKPVRPRPTVIAGTPTPAIAAE